MKKLIGIRQGLAAFSPYSRQEVLELGEKVFALKRFNEKTGEPLYFAVNVSNQQTEVHLPASGLDLISGKRIDGAIRLEPYQFIWMK